MKLPPLQRDKELWLREFDHWVTPFLEEIRDSEIFQKTINNIQQALELIGNLNKGFTTDDAVSPVLLADAVIHGIKDKSRHDNFLLVTAFCDLLFLLTGKTDNNYKCQFPVYVKETLHLKKYPAVRRKKLFFVEVPRVIKSESIAILITQLEDSKNYITEKGIQHLKITNDIEVAQKNILFYYFSFILNQEIYLRSLKVFGSKFFELKSIGAENDLLAPIIISYVRGSASASGGHKPEAILRENMSSWGLIPNEDYNMQDVIPYNEMSSKKDKTRAYDFVLPYKVKNWSNQIFIQSQFYAGDSGSVSHKNVDQTITSRLSVKSSIKDPKFVEYVDGAGYYGSLNGDLKRLFNMDDTYNFFQVRTFPIKLRQLFQEIGFLTPLEIVHVLALNNFEIKPTHYQLKAEGYKEEEVERVFSRSIREKILCVVDDNSVQVNPIFFELSRRYFLLDCIALYGTKLEMLSSEYIIIAGYEEFFGAKISSIMDKIKKISGYYMEDWKHPEVFSKDLEFLLEQKWIIHG